METQLAPCFSPTAGIGYKESSTENNWVVQQKKIQNLLGLTKVSPLEICTENDSRLESSPEKKEEANKMRIERSEDKRTEFQQEVETWKKQYNSISTTKKVPESPIIDEVVSPS